MSIFITSDTHFGHNKDFLFSPRGFSNIEEHDNKIINNWNSIVTNDDIVYLLGDVYLGDRDNGIKCLSQLNGQIKILRGNHDTDNKWLSYTDPTDGILLKNISTENNFATLIQYKKWRFYLSHYPTIVSNFDDGKGPKERVWSLCGHSHAQNKWQDINKGCIYHCELDAHNNFPVKIDTIIEDINNYWQQNK